MKHFRYHLMSVVFLASVAGGLAGAEEAAKSKAEKKSRGAAHQHKHSKKTEACEKSCGADKKCDCGEESHSDHHEGEDNHKH